MSAKKKWGDRRDAARIRGIDGVHTYLVHLLPKRSEAEVFLCEEFDITKLLAYFNQKNEAHPDGSKLTFFHFLVASMSKLLVIRPLLNRYVLGRRYYQRHAIRVGFVAKKQFSDEAKEAVVCLDIKEDYNLFDIQKRITGEVRSSRESDNHGSDDILNILCRLPKWVIALFMGFLRLSNRFDWMPLSLMEMEPNFCSLFFSNLGSIRCGAAYHHLSNFGTNSIFVTIGKIRSVSETDENGTVHEKKVVDIGFTVDERIGEGFYFAKSILLLKHFFEHPEWMELALKEEIPDVS